jgi:arylsulfatase A-like enzyme
VLKPVAKSSDAGSGSHLPAFGFAIGLTSGLIEGVGHMVLQRLQILDNSWYPIIWIAAIFNGLLVGGAGVIFAALFALWPAGARARRVAVFSLFLLAFLPVFALMLKQWIYPYAIGLLSAGAAVAATRWHARARTSIERRRPRVAWPIALTLAAFAIIEGSAIFQERRATAHLPAANATSPNVLLIIVDTLRADHVSSYGYSRQTSPNIDALAAGGVLFENSFASSSYTLPSHASILTGWYPHDHQFEWGTDYRHRTNGPPTLPEKLQELGYRTGAFSANTFYFSREHGFQRGYLHFEDFFHSVTDMMLRTAYGGIATRFIRPRFGWTNLPGRKLASDVVDQSLRWIERDAERPFFVTLNYMDTHDPYMPPQPFRGRFSSTPNPGGLLNSKLGHVASLTSVQLQSEIDAYDGSIAYIDSEISRLLTSLQTHSRRPLLVILTSDHGEEFGEHGGFIHGHHLYREVIQVPLIVWGPGLVRGGTRVKQPVSNTAIAATVMELLNCTPGTFRVPSLVPLWTGTAASYPMPLSELKYRPWEAEHGSMVGIGSVRSLVDDSWHYIDVETREPQLFARPDDPREASDLAGRSDLRPVIDRFRNALK